MAITARATVIDEIPSNPPTARPFIEFFNLKGAFIPVTQFYPFVYGHPNWGIKWQLSYVAPSAVIGSVIFSCEISSPHRVLAAFDHLVFSEDVPRFPQIPLGAGGL